MDEQRRVQITGRNTFIVSLPQEWVRKRGVKKGDALYVQEDADGALSIGVKKTVRAHKTCSISVSTDASDLAMRNIVSAYVGGAGRIILQGKGMSTIAEEARRVLSGVEISDESSDKLILRVLAFDDLHLDNILKRQSTVTQSMFDLAATHFSEGSDNTTEISRKEDEADRLFLLLLRNLSTGRYASSDAAFKAIAAKSIEKIGDHIEDICASGKSMAPNQHVSALINRAGKAYSIAFDALSNNSLDQGEFARARRDFQETHEKAEISLKKEKDVQVMLTLRSLFERCNKLMRYCEDIMESSSDIAFARMEGAPES